MDWVSVGLIAVILYYFSLYANASNSNLSIFLVLIGLLVAIHLGRENGWMMG